MRIPRAPAPPNSRAYSDQRVAAMTPRETRVSIVEEPWRAALNAAAWKGQAAQVTTGRASAATTHCQPVNCSGGIMDSSATGSVRTAATISRRRSMVPRSAVGAEVSPSWWPAAWSVPG